MTQKCYVLHSTILKSPKSSKSDPCIRPSYQSKQIICPLCNQAGRPKFHHFLSQCRFLPEEDGRFFKSQVRQTVSHTIDSDSESDSIGRKYS